MMALDRKIWVLDNLEINDELTKFIEIDAI